MNVDRLGIDWTLEDVGLGVAMSIVTQRYLATDLRVVSESCSSLGGSGGDTLHRDFSLGPRL